MKRSNRLLAILIVVAFVLAACGPATTEAPPAATQPPAQPTATEAPAEEPLETAEATEPATAEATVTATLGPPAGDVSFFSTQFNVVEEAAKFRAILAEGGNYDFTGSEEGALVALVQAGAETGQGQVDLVGALHGTYPSIQNAMMNMTDVVDDLSADRELNQAYLQTGLLGTEDYLYYVPWMQATYIMAAHNDALPYLPAGADINALTYEQFAEWCQTLMDETGGPKCGLPHAGLFNRFLQGFMWPSHTGGMVSQFKSQEAADMLAWARDSLWPTIHPQSISYDFMQEPLLSGEVWVAFDHVARLIQAFNEQPENFVAFPAPAGPAGRGYMPVVVGLGIPNDAPNPEAAMELIDYLTQPETQKRVLSELAFFPVVSGVDTSDLPEGVAIEAGAVEATVNAPDAIAALIPVGLGARGGEINEIFRAAFDRVVLEGEDPATVLEAEAANLQALLDETGAPCWAPDPSSDGPCQVE
jgi:multiple sugar transport system substrate-binding protein